MHLAATRALNLQLSHLIGQSGVTTMMLLHSRAHEHVRFLKISHDGSLIHHILLLMLINQPHKVISKTTHATDHVLLLHPAGIDRPSL